jgi:hypothetical protein
VRADSSDNAFNFSGEFWGENQPFVSEGTTVAAGKTAFKLKLGPKSNAKYYNVCMGEGFIKLISASAACADTDLAGPPTGNYIAVFATDFEDGSGGAFYGRGFVDPKAPYLMGQALPAMRFWWKDVSLAGDATFTTFHVQVNLIDRSGGKNNGNFDVELNYGFNGEQVPPVPNADGFQGFSLGPHRAGPTFGPFGPFDSSGAPLRLWLRARKKTTSGGTDRHAPSSASAARRRRRLIRWRLLVRRH